jgi:hypothetical protein
VVLGESFVNVKSFFSFCSHQGSANEAAMKLLQLQNEAADARAKSAFALQLDFLLAEAWPLRHTAIASGAPLTSQLPAPQLVPAAPSFGSYAPSNSISMGGYAPVFTPTVNITLPTPEPARRAEPPYTRPVQKVVGLEPGLQNAVTAYFPKVGKEGAVPDTARKVLDLKNASVSDILSNFNLPSLERDNQRSDFINTFVADAARKLTVHTVLDSSWARATAEQARQAFETAKVQGDLTMRNRGKKPAKKRENEEDVPHEEIEALAEIPYQFEEYQLEEYASPLKKAASVIKSPLPLATPVYSSESSSDGSSAPGISMADLNSRKVGAGDGSRKVFGGEATSKKQKVVVVEDSLLSKWTKETLQNYLSENNLSKSGSKAVLLQRVQESMRLKEAAVKGKGEAHEEPMYDAATGKCLPMEDPPGGKAVVLDPIEKEPEGSAQAEDQKRLAEPENGGDFVSGGGSFRVKEFVVAKYEDRLCRMEVKQIAEDDSGLIGCHLYGIEEDIWIAQDDLLSLPIPRHINYEKGHFVLHFFDSSRPDYRVGRLDENVQLTVIGSEVKVFKARVDGKTNFVRIQDVETGAVRKQRPHDVIFDLLLSGETVKQPDFLEDNLLFMSVPLQLAKSSQKK